MEHTVARNLFEMVSIWFVHDFVCSNRTENLFGTIADEQKKISSSHVLCSGREKETINKRTSRKRRTQNNFFTSHLSYSVFVAFRCVRVNMFASAAFREMKKLLIVSMANLSVYLEFGSKCFVRIKIQSLDSSKMQDVKINC